MSRRLRPATGRPPDRPALDYPRSEITQGARTFGSVTYDDPDRALEEPTPATLAWQAAQDALAADYLANLPGHAPLPAPPEVMASQFAGGRWFRLVAGAGQSFVGVAVAETPAGPARMIVDLSVSEPGRDARVEWFAPSPDGSKVAFSWSFPGRSLEHFQVADADTGEIVLDGVPQANASFPAWLEDSRSFYFRGTDPADGRTSRIFLCRLGAPPPQAPEPLDIGDPIAWPSASADGRHVLIYASHLSPRPLYIRADGTPDGWRPFLRDTPGMFRGVVHEDRFIAITDDGSPRGRLVSIPLETPGDRTTWRELVGPSDAVLASVALAGGRLILAELARGYSRLRVLAPDGAVEGEIALPGDGVAGATGASRVAINFTDSVSCGPNEIVFVYSSLVQSPALYRGDLNSLTCEPLCEPSDRLDAVVHDRLAASADGTLVPYRELSAPMAGRAGPRPTVIVALAGFNMALLPGWPGPVFAAWVRAGGVLVLAHLRGGGEFGPDWWRAGRRERRARTFEDLYAVAGDLIARGVTTADRLGLHGDSNGAMIVTAAGVLRPDLFAAVAAQTPLTDMFGLVRDPISRMISGQEDGDPEDPAMSEVLRSWSAYQNIVDGVAYPGVLLHCALDDPRSPAWHGRKLAARLQRASASGRPVLLRLRPGGAQTADIDPNLDRRQGEVFAFLASELGLEPGASPGAASLSR